VKAYIKVIILTLICLAVLTPLASDFPDGLEKVAETLGIEEHDPAWKGLMPDYTLPTIDNPYISTFVAGTFGVFLVLGVAFILGIVITKSSR
jgi:cobalt/nickel transport protein